MFVSFSARKNGNCTHIIDYLRMPGDKVILFQDLNVKGCRDCDYECFKNQCKYREDDVYGLLDSFGLYEKVILVVPMYCGNPSSLYFCFNERSQDFFLRHGDDYTAFAERLFIIGVYGSRRETPEFVRCLEKWFEGTAFTDHVLGIERHLYRQGMEDRVTEVEAVRRMLREFLPALSAEQFPAKCENG